MGTDLMATTQGTTARERASLRAIVRQQYRVLRGEIDTRVAALRVEADTRLREKYAHEDVQWKALTTAIDEVVKRAQQEVNDLISASPVKPEPYRYGGGTAHVACDHLNKPTDPNKSRLEQEFQRALSAKASEAKRRFDREEADALRALSTEDIKTPAARAFLDTIPTIEQVLPSSDLLAIEARVDG